MRVQKCERGVSLRQFENRKRMSALAVLKERERENFVHVRARPHM